MKRKFGDQAWTTIDTDFKKMFQQIADMPIAESVPEEIAAIGLVNCRQRPVGQTRIIYQIKEKEISAVYQFEIDVVLNRTKKC